jgi:hypothetical protein
VISQFETFGKIYAEGDFRPEFFVPSTSWRPVRSHDKSIVVGRKGTGKTALGLALYNERLTESDLFVQRLRFSDYPWRVHEQVYDARVGEKARFLETWLFLMLIELAKLAVGEDQAERDLAQAEAVAAVRAFISEIWGSATFDYRDTFTPTRYKVTTSLQPGALGFTLGSKNWEEVERERLGDSLSQMNRWLEEALIGALRAEAEYFLIFDELDLDFDPENQIYMDSMVGLVRAAHRLSNWAWDHGAAVSAVILLRDDLFNALQFSDKNKLTDDLVVRLTWTADREALNSLKAVIDARIAVLLEEIGIPLEGGNADPWSTVFSSEPMESGQEIVDYVVARTHRRPRDLIRFCNLALAEARAKDAGDGDDKIMPGHIEAAEDAYSSYLRQELRDEVFSHHPDADRWLELLRRIGTQTFELIAFDKECSASSDLLSGTGQGSVLKIFYNFGVIGCANRGAATEDEVYWTYDEPSRPLDIGAPFFQVHPGLQKNLGIAP